GGRGRAGAGAGRRRPAAVRRPAARPAPGRSPPAGGRIQGRRASQQKIVDAAQDRAVGHVGSRKAPSSPPTPGGGGVAFWQGIALVGGETIRSVGIGGGPAGGAARG